MRKTKPSRRSIRLKGYDYRQEGAYFVTLCTYRRREIFGRVIDGEVDLRPAGLIAQEEWLRSETIRQEIQLDRFVIMPNHLHVIVMIAQDDTVDRTDVGATGRSAPRNPGPPPKSLGSLIAGYKAAVTIRMRLEIGYEGERVWQRNYFERVIRGDGELDRLRTYINHNPLMWELDRYYSG